MAPDNNDSDICARHVEIEEKTEMQAREPDNQSNAHDIDFDEILPIVGEFGIYQQLLFLCTIPCGVYLAFVYFAQIFQTLLPDQYWCNVPELANLTLEKSRALSIPLTSTGGYSKCHMYNVNYTEILLNGTDKADVNWEQVSCRNGWHYDFSVIPYETVATQQNWVCERGALATYAQSIFFLGAITGGLLCGWMADRFGRVPTIVVCNLIGCAAGVLTAFTTNFWEFAVCRFFVGIAFDNCFMMMYILVLEYVGPKYRTLVANMPIALFFTGGASILPWIAYWISDWKYFAVATSLPMALVLIAPFLVPESARWLISHNKHDKALRILKKMASVNGKTVSPDVFFNFYESCKRIQAKDANKKNYSLLDLFKTPRLRRITILLLLIWMADSLVFDGHARNVGAMGFNVFITFSLACATECPAGFVLLAILDKWGRRWVGCGTLVASGIFSILAALFPGGILSITFAIIGRFFVNISYNVGMQYAAELLPTVVRGQGVAFIHIMGFLATILSPFIVYLANVSVALPLIILGLIGIVGGLCSLLLPETLGKELPQTLYDGENFGRDQEFWSFPCIKKRH